ncbi:MAG: DNA-deoxyinosine glycosylase [Thiohalocapsa sp.]
MANALKTALPPVIGEQPRLLILGSMPGEASLRNGQYYGHGRNAFWPILCDWLSIPTESDYQTRTRALIANRIALWDVIATCERRGSLDANIRPDSIEVNDFATFFREHQDIRCVAFNGGTVEREFRRRVQPELDDAHRQIEWRRLPSTSPANAGTPFETKRGVWHALLNRYART